MQKGRFYLATQSEQGYMFVESKPKVLDLGLIVDGAPGGNGYQIVTGSEVPLATVPLIVGCEWVRHILLFYKNSSQTSELRITRYADAAATIGGTISVTGLGASFSWTSMVLGSGGALASPVPQSAVLGLFAKLSMKNVGGATADMWLRAVLLG